MIIAVVGHNGEFVGARRIEHPCWKGSVFDAFMLIRTLWWLMLMSEHSSVVSASNLLIVGDTYSDDHRKPKNAAMNAAHIMV